MYVFSYKFYGRFIILLNLLLGRRVYYSPVFKNKNSIKFVNTSNYTKLIEESRKLVFNYFKSKESNFKDNKLKLLNYVLKYYDLNFTSFYVFVHPNGILMAIGIIDKKCKIDLPFFKPLDFSTKYAPLKTIIVPNKAV